MNESEKVKKLYKKLKKEKINYFDNLNSITDKQGVYVIYSRKTAFHVGRTYRGKKGLRQRINNHLRGQSSFVKNYLRGEKRSLLEKKYYFKYSPIANDRIRALLEAYTIGVLCPKHIGTGKKKESIDEKIEKRQEEFPLRKKDSEISLSKRKDMGE